MFLERIRKQFSKKDLTPSAPKEKTDSSPLSALNNKKSPQHQVESPNKSFPDNYFDSDSLFK